jgi:hypothetical protein
VGRRRCRRRCRRCVIQAELVKNANKFLAEAGGKTDLRIHQFFSYYVPHSLIKLVLHLIKAVLDFITL